MKKINSNTERVYVYDSNFPKNSNYVELYLENGEYVGFSYNDGMGDVYKTIYFDTISYFDFSMIWKIWQNRGSDNSSYGSTMLSVGSDNAVIYNAAGIICATITDGRLVSSAGGISRLTVDGNTDTSDNHLLNLPEGDYTVVDKDGGGIYVSLYDDGNVCEVTADSSAVKLSADESADVAISLSEGDNYEVKISTDSGDYTASGTADSDGTLKFVA
jgi:hypothetical protein